MISRPGLRWVPFWWACDWAITLAVVVSSLLPADDLQRLAPDFNDKLMHFSSYFLMAMWFAGSLDPRRYGALLVSLCTLGALVEGAQYAMGLGREADWKDMLANALGALSALALARAGLGNWMAWIERRFVRG
jgi:VanZ family protein